MELSWFFQYYLDYGIGDPEIVYTLEVAVDDTLIELADFFAAEPSDTNPQDEHQDNYIPNINIDGTVTTVKLHTDNISTLMSMLGITGVTPVDFYKFIGILLQEVEFPTQTTVPTLGNDSNFLVVLTNLLTEKYTGELIHNMTEDTNDKLILEFGTRSRLLQLKYSVMHDIIQVVMSTALLKI